MLKRQPDWQQRQRQLWREQKRRRRQREDNGVRVTNVRYDGATLNKLVRLRCLSSAKADACDITAVGLAIERLLAFIDLSALDIDPERTVACSVQRHEP